MVELPLMFDLKTVSCILHLLIERLRQILKLLVLKLIIEGPFGYHQPTFKLQPLLLMDSKQLWYFNLLFPELKDHPNYLSFFDHHQN
jgi:hypothetical protein